MRGRGHISRTPGTRSGMKSSPKWRSQTNRRWIGAIVNNTVREASDYLRLMTMSNGCQGVCRWPGDMSVVARSETVCRTRNGMDLVNVAAVTGIVARQGDNRRDFSVMGRRLLAATKRLSRAISKSGGSSGTSWRAAKFDIEQVPVSIPEAFMSAKVAGADPMASAVLGDSRA